MRVINVLIYYLICFATWLLLTNKLGWQNLVTGAFISLLTTIIFARYFNFDVSKMINPARWFWMIIYIIYFIWQCVKANFDVAYRVLHPAMPIKPGIVRVELKLQGSLARTILANSITMTPGTIAVDIIGDVMYVHWIYVRSTDHDDYAYIISGKFERILKKIFE
ncbi:MAG: Na+/H+ antiporter subunit E [Bacteroidales bacterium]|nr:Na+/H+ antiporter subunit E [Bacteroidales bacterium]